MPQPKAEEFFYLDEHGMMQDDDLHRPILSVGDHAAAEAVGKAVMREHGLSDDSIERLMPWHIDQAKLAAIRAKRGQKAPSGRSDSSLDIGVRFDETEHPRDSDGKWTDKGGGDGSADGQESGSAGQPEAEGAGLGATGHGTGDGLPGPYQGKSLGNAQGVGGLKGTTLAAQFTLKAGSEIEGATPLEFFELGAGGGQVFHDAIAASKNASKYGAAVTAYSPEDYDKLRTFLAADSKIGFALNGDDIVSVFKHPDSTAEHAATSVLALAVQQGGARLDCFDTALPKIYSDSGFRATARLAFDEKYQPDNWDKKLFGEFNDGKPDVVFMIHDPKAQANFYQPGDGKVVASYDEGIAAQRAALNDASQRRGRIWWHGSASGDLRGGRSGLHLGTRRAAVIALGAQIGIPADGKGWTGDRAWGKTKLAGVKTLLKFDPRGYNQTGFNSGGPKIKFPQEDFFAPDYIAKNPSERPSFPDGSYLSFDAVPRVEPFQIVGGMTNSVDRPHSDDKANALMKAQLTKGTAKNGFFYENISEDSGSISAVVPNGDHLTKAKL